MSVTRLAVVAIVLRLYVVVLIHAEMWIVFKLLNHHIAQFDLLSGKVFRISADVRQEMAAQAVAQADADAC